GELADGRAFGPPQHPFQLSELGFGGGSGRRCAGLGTPRDGFGCRLLLLRHDGLHVLHHRPGTGPACMLPLPTFSSRQADHGIAKIATARYFHGSVACSTDAGGSRSEVAGGHLRPSLSNQPHMSPSARPSCGEALRPTPSITGAALRHHASLAM